MMHVYNEKTRAENKARLRERMQQLRDGSSCDNGCDISRFIGNSYEDVAFILKVRDCKSLIITGPPGSREDFLQRAENYRLAHGLKSVWQLTKEDIGK